MRNIFAKLRSLPRRSTAIVAMLVAVIAVPAALYAWGPDGRVTFTWAKPASYVTFNSITDNPKQGDERDFFKIRNYTDGGQFTDKINLEVGKEYEITAYYHNNAATPYNSAENNYKGIAKGAFMRVEMPEVIGAGETGRMNAFVGASNAKHLDKNGNDLGNQVWDEVYGTNNGTGDMILRYVQNSATIRNNGALNGTAVSLDSLISQSGTPLGYDKLDGTLPGCEQYSGFVTYRITVDQPNFDLYKEVRKAGVGDWGEKVEVDPGDEVEFRIKYKNTGTIKQEPVTINDKLPTGLTYVAGSTLFSNQTTGNQYVAAGSEDIVNNGLNLGGYLPGGSVYVKFKAKVDEASLKCGVNNFVNNAYANTENGTKRDTAEVVVNKECEPEPTPEYRCDLLEVNRFDANGVAFNVKWSQSDGVTKKSHVVRVYDAQGKEVYNTIDNKFSQLAAGKYTIKAFVTFTVDGKDEEVTSTACTAERTIEEEEKPAIKIEKLVNGAEHTPVDLNEEFNYQIKVTNTGNVELKDAVVTDKQPTGVTFVSASEGKIDNGTWTTTISSLKVGESKSFTIQAKITKYVEGKIKNTACVDAPTIPGDNDGCDDATVEVPPAPEAGEETVCELETSEIITIDEGDFDSSKHSKNLDDCKEVPVVPENPETPDTPSELPQTGANDAMIGGLGLGALATTTIAYVASRRRIIG